MGAMVETVVGNREWVVGGGGGGDRGWAVVVGVLVACSNIPILFEETFNCPTVKAEEETVNGPNPRLRCVREV